MYSDISVKRISALYLFSLRPTHNMDEMQSYIRYIPTRILYIIFLVIFEYLIYFRVKSPIIKIIEDNIFEGMTNRFYILLLFDFVFDFQKKNNFVHLKNV